MTFGSGGQQQVAQTSNEPWAGQAPHLASINNQARAQYISGGPQYYPGSTVAGFTPQQSLAFDQITKNANSGGASNPQLNSYIDGSLGQNNISLADANRQAGQVAKTGLQSGVSNLQNGASNHFGNLNAANSQAIRGQAPFLSDLQQAPDLTGQLQRTANGNYLGSNPYLDQVFDTAARKVTDTFNNEVVPGVNSSFGAAGRSGGGLSALALGDEAEKTRDSLNDLAGSIYAPAYEAERGRQVSAAGTLGGLEVNAAGVGLNNALQTNTLGSSLYNSAKSNQLQAGSALGQLGLGGLSAQNSIYDSIDNSQYRAGGLAQQGINAQNANQFQNTQALLGAGNQIQGNAQSQMDANQARYDFYQNSPYTNLARYSDIVNRAPSGIGQTTQAAPGASQGANALGGAAAGAGIGSQIYPGWGTAIGAGVGALGGYYL